jgi:hypothetical protein
MASIVTRSALPVSRAQGPLQHQCRYNTKLQNAVYLSIRTARAELGSFSRKDNVTRWFRELQHYGFIVMESGPCLGVEGRGKAPHFRLTEEWYLGRAPTRDFLNWNGDKFCQQKTPEYYLRQKQNPVPYGGFTLSRPVGALAERFGLRTDKSVPHGGAILEGVLVPDGEDITSLTTPSVSASASAVPDDGLGIPDFLRR